jgi:hypothetical protein
MMQKSIPKPAKPVTEYIDTIERTNYADNQSLQLLVSLLNARLHPFIDIGTYKGYKYRLAPSAMEMCADEARIDWNSELPFAPECVLGVEVIDVVIQGLLQAEPQELDGEELTSDTTNTSSATLAAKNDHTGFAFMQLGKVHKISTSDWTEASCQDKEAHEMHWEATGYVLAVVIKDDGSASEIWVLFDFEPLDEFTQEVFSIASDDPDWGYLKGDEVRRAGVKIADSIRELGEEQVWTMDKWIKGRYELVRTLKRETAQLVVRQLGHRKGKIEREG